VRVADPDDRSTTIPVLSAAQHANPKWEALPPTFGDIGPSASTGRRDSMAPRPAECTPAGRQRGPAATIRRQLER
jgi:hypothetical protein